MARLRRYRLQLNRHQQQILMKMEDTATSNKAVVHGAICPGLSTAGFTGKLAT